MAMRAAARGGCTYTVRESALKVDCGRQSLVAPGTRPTRVSITALPSSVGRSNSRAIPPSPGSYLISSSSSSSSNNNNNNDNNVHLSYAHNALIHFQCVQQPRQTAISRLQKDCVTTDRAAESR